MFKINLKPFLIGTLTDFVSLTSVEVFNLWYVQLDVWPF